MLLLAIATSVLISFFIPTKNVDPLLQPWLDKYMLILKEECPDKGLPLQVTVKFEELKEPSIGLCGKRFTGFTLRVDSLFWLFSDDNAKFNLTAHEFGHCIMGLHHVEDPGNYMFFSYNVLTDEQIEQQVREDMRRTCK